MLLFLPEYDAQGMQLVREKGEIQSRTLAGNLSGAESVGGWFKKEFLDNVDRKERIHFRRQ